MKENVRFYNCPICGNIVGLIEGDMEHITCCGKPMEAMIANTTDASVEKHVPVYEKVEDEIVELGTLENPIEYNGNMILEIGKYYIQDGIIYLCNRDTGNPVYHNLSDLVGLYVEYVKIV